MDFLGLKIYIEQKLYQYKKWLNTSRGEYYNRDLIADILQVITLVVTVIVIVV